MTDPWLYQYMGHKMYEDHWGKEGCPIHEPRYPITKIIAKSDAKCNKEWVRDRWKQWAGIAFLIIVNVNLGGANGKLAGLSLSRIPSAKGLKLSNNASLVASSFTP